MTHSKAAAAVEKDLLDMTMDMFGDGSTAYTKNADGEIMLEWYDLTKDEEFDNNGDVIPDGRYRVRFLLEAI